MKDEYGRPIQNGCYIMNVSIEKLKEVLGETDKDSFNSLSEEEQKQLLKRVVDAMDSIIGNYPQNMPIISPYYGFIGQLERLYPFLMEHIEFITTTSMYYSPLSAYPNFNRIYEEFKMK